MRARFPWTAFLVLLAEAVASAGDSVDKRDWPHWRGLDRNGIVRESSGYRGGEWKVEEAWKIDVGASSSSPIVIGDRVYVLGTKSGRESVYCLDTLRGEVLWKQSYKAPDYGRNSTGDKGSYSGVSSTPEYSADDGCLYTLGIDGDLHCWNVRDGGKKVWGLNLYERYGVKRRPQVGKRGKTRRDYGYSTSPLVHGKQLIVEVGASSGNLVGFDKKSGRELWRSACHDEAGHSGGPVPLVIEGVPCVAVLTLRNLHVARLDAGHEGETVGLYPWVTDYANNIPTPAVHENEVIVTSAYNQYAMCKLRVGLDGVKKVWEQRNPSGVCSPVIYEGYVYWAWRGVHAIDFETGNELWRGGDVGTTGSCLVTADGRLVVWANRGDLMLVDTVKHSRAKYRELAKQRRLVENDAWPHVVLARGKLFLKGRGGMLKCLRIRP